jgi:pimeloyl-ACP methyl ester carboxylesterase
MPTTSRTGTAGTERTALVLPGTASSGRFVTAAFGPAVAAAGYRLVTFDPPAGPAPLDSWRSALTAAMGTWRPALVGGVSLGAHLAAEWLLRHGRTGQTRGWRVEGLLVALPGWLGVPDADPPAVAAALASAALVERDGLAGALRAATAGVPGWLAEELRRSWSRYHPEDLCTTLRATANAPAPTETELAGLSVPVGVAAFTDDPVHPAEVARRWASLPRRAGYREQPIAAMSTGPGALGAAALAAWRAARALPA